MKVSRKVLYTWIPISLLVFLIAAFWLSIRWQPPQGQTRTAVLSSTGSGAPKDLIARGWIQSNRVNPGDKVHFWITFMNASDHDIQDLHLLYLHTPGFEPAPPCWTSSKHPLPSCFEGTSSFPASLKSGASVTLLSDLKATSLAG